MHSSRFTRSALSTALFAALFQAFASPSVMAQAQTVAPNTLPTGANVVAGSVRTNVNGANMTLTQSSNAAVVNWNSFNIGSAATVNINQPSANAIMLNRVVGNDPTQIRGQLNANGQIMLVNPNGIVVGREGRLSVSGFTASSYGITDADFLSGSYLFNRAGSKASVINEGLIQTTAGGYVSLIGAQVSQSGRIIAPEGQVVMATGESVQLSADSPATIGLPLSARIRINVTPSTINAAVTNTADGVIVTSGGQVMLQAAAVSDAVASVTHRGLIDTSAEQGGRVSILAPAGQIRVNGTINTNSLASGNRAGGDIVIGRDPQTGVLARSTDVSQSKLTSKGGMIETSGEVLKIDGASVSAASWLLDPLDVIITDTSVNGYGAGQNSSNTSLLDSVTLGNSITGGAAISVLTSAAGSGAGDIYINSPVTSLGSGSLWLKADRNIVLDSTIQAGAGNKLDLHLNARVTDGVGSIWLKPGAKILTGGGHLTLGGGSVLGAGGTYFQTAAKGYGAGDFKHGVYIDHAEIDTQTGDLMINGRGSPDGLDATGVTVVNSKLWGGQVVLEGTGGGKNTLASNNHGVLIRQSEFVQTILLSHLVIEGNNSLSDAGMGHGLQIENTNINSIGKILLKGNSSLSDKSGIDLTAVTLKTNGTLNKDRSWVWLEGQSVNGEGITSNLYLNIDAVGYIDIHGTTQNPNKNAILLSSTQLEPSGAATPYRNVWTSRQDYISVTGDNIGLVAGGSETATGVAIKAPMDVSAFGGTTITSKSGGIYLGYSLLDPSAPSWPVINGVTYTGNYVTSQATINATTGFLTLLAGDGTADSNANILVASGEVSPTPVNLSQPYIQVLSPSLNVLSNAKLRLTSEGNGNVYVPRIVMAGSGNVIITAGLKKAAGDGSGGQVRDTGGTLTTNGGKTYIYSGTEEWTWCLECMNPAFTPYISSGPAANVAYNRSYQQGAITTTSQTQVLYRAVMPQEGSGSGGVALPPAPGSSQPSQSSSSTPVTSQSGITEAAVVISPAVTTNAITLSATAPVQTAPAMSGITPDSSKAESILPTKPIVYAANGTRVSLIRYGAGVQGRDFSQLLVENSAAEGCDAAEAGTMNLASAASESASIACLGGGQ